MNKLFAVICPTFGHKFAFNADDKEQAKELVQDWNHYHGFRGTDTCTFVQISIEQMAALQISIHNEYLSRGR